MSDEVVKLIAKNTLACNSTLTELDLHAQELGHVNMTDEGVAAIIEALRNNNRCALGDLDISTDDDVAGINEDLQKQLKEQLQLRRHLLPTDKQHVCDYPIYQCHSDDY